MTDTALTKTTSVAEAVELALTTGDIGKLSTEGRVNYYHSVCKSLGVNPLTRPFEYLVLNGKTVLYCRRDATDQLRRLNNVSVGLSKTERFDDVYVVTALARMGDREDTSTGAVSIKGLGGEALANALMKAETKAKRRVTLSIVGLGFLDETEIETIPMAKPVNPVEAAQEIPYTSSPAAEAKIAAKAAATTPAQTPKPNARNVRMAKLVRLGTEWYGEGAMPFAIKNHVKKTYNIDSAASLTDEQIEAQITEFGRRIDARKADMEMQPSLAPFDDGEASL